MRLKKEDKITEILKKISPGTPIRNGLENILRARTGALLYFTNKKNKKRAILMSIMNGDFFHF